MVLASIILLLSTVSSGLRPTIVFLILALPLGWTSIVSPSSDRVEAAPCLFLSRFCLSASCSASKVA